MTYTRTYGDVLNRGETAIPADRAAAALMFPGRFDRSAEHLCPPSWLSGPLTSQPAQHPTSGFAGPLSLQLHASMFCSQHDRA